MKRMQYLLGRGPKSTRALSYVALGLAVISLALVLFIGYNAIYGSIFDIPALRLFFTETEIREARDDLLYEIDEMSKFVEEFDEEVAALSPDERAEIENKLGMTLEEYREQRIQELMQEVFGEHTELTSKDILKVIETFSLQSIMRVVENIPGSSELEGLILVKIIYKALIASFIFFAAMIALAAIFLKKWPMILEFILALAIYVVFGGIVMTIILFVLMLTYCIIQSITEKDWKQYKRNGQVA
jgi:hypothetical protein